MKIFRKDPSHGIGLGICLGLSLGLRLGGAQMLAEVRYFSLEKNILLLNFFFKVSFPFPQSMLLLETQSTFFYLNHLG